MTSKRLHWMIWPLVALGLLALVVGAFEWVAYPRTAWTADTLAANAPQVVLRGEVDRLHASFVRAGLLYGVEDHFVYVSRDSGRSFDRIGVIPKIEPSVSEALKDFVARRGMVRLLRRSPDAAGVIVLSSGTVLVFYDRIYRMAAGTAVFEPVEAPTVADVFLGGIAIGPGDTIYFGEYVTGQRPNAPRILRGSRDGTRWEEAYTFPPGAIYHVHSVRYDRWRAGYWVATGDQDPETGLWFTADNFRTLDRIAGGAQEWRVVAPLVREHELIWGSDDDRGPAGIYRWDMDDRSLARLQTTYNPSYFAGELSDGTLVITTTYEPESDFSRSTSGYPYTSIWASRDGEAWSEVLRLQGDAVLESGRRVRPQIRLPSGDGSLPQLYATPLWTASRSLETLILQVQW